MKAYFTTKTNQIQAIKLIFSFISVPIWASECTVRAMPALTIQYMTDSGTIQLSRDCGDDGDRRIMTCQGKQDHEMILKTLSCSDEQNSLTSENDISVKVKDLPVVKNEVLPVSSDNNENNHIDLTNGIESGDEKIINKIDLEDMMLGDQHIEEEVEKKKEVVVNKKKTEVSKKKIVKNKNREDDMMGDQPVSNEESTMEPVTEEHLPHNKKSLVQDLVHKEVASSTILTPTTTDDILSTTESLVVSAIEQLVFSTTEENIPTTLVTELVEDVNVTKRATDLTTETTIAESTTIVPLTTEEIPTTTATTSTSAPTTIAPATTSVAVEVTQKTPMGIHPIPHLLHKPEESVPTTTVFNKITNPTLERTTTQHHENPTSKDHFIPPMLLVKAQFLSTKPHVETTSQPPKTESTPTESSIQSSTNEILETSSATAVSEKNDEEIITKATSESVTTEVSPSENQENSTETFSNKLSNADNFQPYRPNRRRSLTKPESEHRSYIKKILG